MVCQHYFDLSVTWRPRFGESELYSYRNSSSSSVGSVGSLESAVSVGSAKRGRRVSGGYPCRQAGCGKVFDVPSDLRHHERKHTAKANRPYGCHCGERFLYPKDLTRHSTNVHKERLSTVEQALVVDSSDSLKRMKRRANSPPTVSPERSQRGVRHVADFQTVPRQEPVEVPEDTESFHSRQAPLPTITQYDAFGHSNNTYHILPQRPRTWLRRIDELLFLKKGFRDVETSSAIARLSRQLDQFDIHDEIR